MLIVLFTSVYLLPNLDTINKLKKEKASLQEEIDKANLIVNKYEELKNKIKRYRQAGLDKSGEYSTENLVFKILRNSGYLEKWLS